MIVLRTSVYVKLCIHLSSQRSLRKHALYSELDNLLRLLVHHLTQSGLFHTAYVIRVMIVNLLIQLLAGYFDLVCIYNDSLVCQYEYWIFVIQSPFLPFPVSFPSTTFHLG